MTYHQPFEHAPWFLHPPVVPDGAWVAARAAGTPARAQLAGAGEPVARMLLAARATRAEPRGRGAELALRRNHLHSSQLRAVTSFAPLWDLAQLAHQRGTRPALTIRDPEPGPGDVHREIA
jgi:hypothetical protein